MPMIWGLDLRDIQWGKFKSSYMFKNRDYHLRRTKFVIYQCAMILLVVSESLGTAVLSDYIDQQNRLQNAFPGIDVFNNDYVGIASFNIFVGVLSATVFGAAFFFDLFFPERYEPRWVENMWMGSAVFCAVAGLGDALAYTYIVARRKERINGVSPDDANLTLELARESSKTPILYRDSGRAIASVVLLWLGWVCAVGSCYVMISFYRYVRRTGTSKSQHAIVRDDPFKEKRNDAADEPTIPKPEPATPPYSGNNHYVIENQSQP